MLSSIKRTLLFVGGGICGAALVATFAFHAPDDKNKLVDVQQDGRLQYKWYPPELPKTISFAGESTPLDRPEVKDRLDREVLMNYYMHGSLIYVLKLSTRYFPQIEAKLKANNIPDDFKYLCVAESSLQHLTSSAGAQSFWQFVAATGTQFGLQIDAEVDERYDIDKATDAACRYFKAAHDKFGTWTAAAASYNCGTGGYNGAATYQHSMNYYDLLLPEETNRYVFRILAFKYLISNARTMGYIVEGADTYKPFKTRNVAVDTSITDLAQYAINNGTSYKLIKLYNPWLRGHSLTIKGGKTYQIALPM